MAAAGTRRAPLSLAASAFAWFGYFFLLLPSLIVLPMSFGDKDEFEFPPKRLSFYLYEKYFNESTWMATTWTSFKIAICTMIVSLVLGVAASYALARGSDFRGKRIATAALMSPMFVPHIAVALALYLYFSYLRVSGTLLSLVLSHTALIIPFVMVTAFAGLRHVDRNLEIAAAVMGAGRFTILRRVTLPLLMPTILSAALFAFLLSFDEVVVSYFIAGVQYQTLPVKMYSSIHWEISPVLAAVSSLLTLLSLAVCLVAAAWSRPQ